MPLSTSNLNFSISSSRLLTPIIGNAMGRTITYARQIVSSRTASMSHEPCLARFPTHYRTPPSHRASATNSTVLS